MAAVLSQTIRASSSGLGWLRISFFIVARQVESAGVVIGPQPERVVHTEAVALPGIAARFKERIADMLDVIVSLPSARWSRSCRE